MSEKVFVKCPRCDGRSSGGNKGCMMCLSSGKVEQERAVTYILIQDQVDDWAYGTPTKSSKENFELLAEVGAIHPQAK